VSQTVSVCSLLHSSCWSSTPPPESLKALELELLLYHCFCYHSISTTRVLTWDLFATNRSVVELMVPLKKRLNLFPSFESVIYYFFNYEYRENYQV
jgi:hypothetical protein